MRKAVWLTLAVGLFCGLGMCAGQAPGTAIHFVNGMWFNGSGFEKNDLYAVGGMFSHTAPAGDAVETVDLHGGFVVPPYGDAHEHNFDHMDTPKVGAQYLQDGIFYAQGMTDTTTGPKEIVAKGLVNTPQTVDVTYAHGCLTGVNGHPVEIYESLANGFYYPQTEAQRALVIGGRKMEGLAFWQIDSLGTLQKKWPEIVASKPDLIKIILSDSEHFKPATVQDPQLGKGINPALVPEIVKLAHAAGLKVAAHIDTSFDFHVAVTAGVDEMGHLPGYGMLATEDAAKYRLQDADIALARKQHTKVQATAGIYTDEKTPAADAAARRNLQIDGLKRLKAAGVTVLVGSDHYGMDSVHEADYLQALGVWTNAEMLRMWAVTTPQTIFPRRKLGELKDGDEASLLVLTADPVKDWSASHRIVGRWKDGVRLSPE